MIKQSENRKIALKEKEWDEIASPFDRAWCGFNKERRIITRMITDWFFFYKARTKSDKRWHMFGVAIVYVILQFAWIGLLKTFGLD